MSKELTVEAVMKWLADASRKDLELIGEELIDRGFVADLDDVPEEPDWSPPTLDEVEDELLDAAAARFQRREYSEALHLLERALGRDFTGLGELRVEAA